MSKVVKFECNVIKIAIFTQTRFGDGHQEKLRRRKVDSSLLYRRIEEKNERKYKLNVFPGISEGP
jgi:hypothetical protein